MLNSYQVLQELYNKENFITNQKTTPVLSNHLVNYKEKRKTLPAQNTKSTYKPVSQYCNKTHIVTTNTYIKYPEITVNTCFSYQKHIFAKSLVLI